MLPAILLDPDLMLHDILLELGLMLPAILLEHGPAILLKTIISAVFVCSLL
jgi:hypothetical protein